MKKLILAVSILLTILLLIGIFLIEKRKAKFQIAKINKSSNLEWMKLYIYYPMISFMTEKNCPTDQFKKSLDVSIFANIVDKSRFDYFDFYKIDYRLSDYEVRFDSDQCAHCVLIRNPGENGKFDTDIYDFENQDAYDDIVILNNSILYQPQRMTKELKLWTEGILDFINDGLTESGIVFDIDHYKKSNSYLPLVPEGIVLSNFNELKEDDKLYEAIKTACEGHDVVDMWGHKIKILVDKNCCNNIAIVSAGLNGRFDESQEYSINSWHGKWNLVKSITWGNYSRFEIPEMDDLVMYNGEIFCGPEGNTWHTGHWNWILEDSRKERKTLNRIRSGKQILEECEKSSISEDEIHTALLFKSISDLGVDGFPSNKKELQHLIANRNHSQAMVKIPAGSFTMGTTEHEENDGRYAEMPRIKVHLKSFLLDAAEVTVSQFKEFCDKSGHSMRIQPEWNESDHPVVKVSWHDAKTYCEWAGKRLPTESEWEYAARAGQAHWTFPWGNKLNHDLANYKGIKGHDRWNWTSPVCSFEPNKFGVYDLTGNAWEWVEDCWHGSYKGAPDDGRAWVDENCEERILRGGSWLDDEYNGMLEIDNRTPNKPFHWSEAIGFRCAKSAE